MSEFLGFDPVVVEPLPNAARQIHEISADVAQSDNVNHRGASKMDWKSSLNRVTGSYDLDQSCVAVARHILWA